MENMLGNTLGTWGTYLKLDGNSKGTHWEPRKKEKTKCPPPPFPTKILKEKKTKTTVITTC